MTQFIIVNGIKLAYIAQGDPSNPPVIFIHGLAENTDAWAKNLDGLQDDFYCIAIDLPGHGNSEGGEHPYTPYFYADTIAGFVAALGFGQVTVVGHSLGGQVAIVLAISRPHIVNKLVLVSPAGFETFTEKDERWILDQARNYTAQVQGFDFLKIWPNYKKPSQQVYQASVAGMLAQTVFAHLHEVKVPTLVIFGNDDPFIPNRFLHPLLTVKNVAESGTKQIPGARLLIIKHAGHFVNLEKANEVNEAIKDFIIG